MPEGIVVDISPNALPPQGRSPAELSGWGLSVQRAR
jgi:hypothetical protein